MSYTQGQRVGPALQYLRLQGFKSLRDPVEAECRLLTILAGNNSSGKSSLMQPLLLLKQTFDAPYDPGPLLLDGPNVTFSDVRQLFWHAAGTSRKESFVITLQSGPEHSLEITFGRVTGQTRSRPESIGLTKCIWKFGQKTLELRPSMSKEKLDEAVSTVLALLGVKLSKELRDRSEVVRNRALLTVGVGGDVNWPGPWTDYERLLRDIIHVPGLRGNPRRTYRSTAAGDYFPGVFQDYVASVVAAWQEGNDPRIQAIGDDLHRLGLTWKVDARQVSATEVELRVGRLQEGRRGGAQDMVNIADVGFGVSQVLPVVVSLQAAGPGQLVYLEQPEIHLHPRAQASLAELLKDAVNRGVQVVVETHSELLLLSVQRLVAEGRLSLSKVKLHWFSRNEVGVTGISSADLDENGSFGEWPVDFADVSMRAMQSYLDASLSEQKRLL